MEFMLIYAIYAYVRTMTHLSVYLHTKYKLFIS